MSGSSFGKLFTISTWGESHGKALGVVVDGCPAGVELNEEDIQQLLSRRQPGKSKFATPRQEGDKIEILSGVFNGKTTGTPISMMVKNEDQRSRDYGNLAYTYRPGHADMTYDARYGLRDYRGGGRSSGRETVGRVAAGAIAKKVLLDLGIEVHAYTKAIGPVHVEDHEIDLLGMDNDLNIPNEAKYKEAAAYLDGLRARGNSSGGLIECVVKNYPAGCGNPVFEKLDALLAQAIMSIGAVKGVEIGAGFKVSEMTGSENNDLIEGTSFNRPVKHSNNAGGILGGISDGSPIILRAAVKPTPSIGTEQKTVTNEGKTTSIVIKGRHDPVIVPRAVVVVESMVALTLLDALLQMPIANIENVYRFLNQ